MADVNQRDDDLAYCWDCGHPWDADCGCLCCNEPPFFTGTADDLTDHDRFLLRSGAILPSGAWLILPSGRKITSGKWAELGGAV